MSGEAKEILDNIQICNECLYNQGKIDGIKNIIDMVEGNKEVEWTFEILMETLHSFVDKYDGGKENSDIETIPPTNETNIGIPEEFSNSGMSEEAFHDMMELLGKEDVVEEKEMIELSDIIVKEGDNNENDSGTEE